MFVDRTMMFVALKAKKNNGLQWDFYFKRVLMQLFIQMLHNHNYFKNVNNNMLAKDDFVRCFKLAMQVS
jgi:hypothetical protein